MKTLIERLYEERSMTIADFLIDEFRLKHPHIIEDHKALLRMIYESTDLDERRALCAEFLDYRAEAKKLREWIKQKKTRRGCSMAKR